MNFIEFSETVLIGNSMVRGLLFRAFELFVQINVSSYKFELLVGFYCCHKDKKKSEVS